MLNSSQPLQTVSSPTSGRTAPPPPATKSAEHDLFARCEIIHVVKDVLDTLSGVEKDAGVTLLLLSHGIKLTVVKESKVVLAHAFLQAALFTEYSIREEGIRFTVSLPILSECISLFGSGSYSSSSSSSSAAAAAAASSATSSSGSSGAGLVLSQGGEGEPLVLRLDEAGVVTECAIRTLLSEDPINFVFATSDVRAKAIVTSNAIHDALYEMEGMAPIVEIAFHPETETGALPVLKMGARGPSGACEIEFPAGGGASTVVESFEAIEPLSYLYTSSLLHASLKALALAAKTSLRVNSAGILSLQHMIIRSDHRIFVEFFVSPNEVYDEDGDP